MGNSTASIKMLIWQETSRFTGQHAGNRSAINEARPRCRTSAVFVHHGAACVPTPVVELTWDRAKAQQHGQSVMPAELSMDTALPRSLPDDQGFYSIPSTRGNQGGTDCTINSRKISTKPRPTPRFFCFDALAQELFTRC